MTFDEKVLEIFHQCNGFGVFDGGLATEIEKRGADLKDYLYSAVCLLDKDLSELVKQVGIRETLNI